MYKTGSIVLVIGTHIARFVPIFPQSTVYSLSILWDANEPDLFMKNRKNDVIFLTLKLIPLKACRTSGQGRTTPMQFLAQDREVAVIRQMHKVGLLFTAPDFHLVARFELFTYLAVHGK